MLSDLEMLLLEDTQWVATRTIDVPLYDFAFERYFACRRPLYLPAPVTAIGRFGVVDDYSALYASLVGEGIRLVHTPAQYALATELPLWYPRLAGLTPRSCWFAEAPSAEEIERLFGWPVFVKGSRQTSRHKAALSIIRDPAAYRAAMQEYARNPILRHQAVIVRELIDLRPVQAPQSDVIPASFEFRTFWWHGVCVGEGPYWAAVARYTWSDAERAAALQVAGEAAHRLQLPFVVVDVAQTRRGDWTVIEVNDAQESGYAGIAPLALWQRLIAASRPAARLHNPPHEHN